jgi:hypothetical protein
MMSNIDAYPLFWPHSWPRTSRPMAARFETSFASARDNLFYELKMLGAKNIVLSTNVELRRDGLPYAGRKPEDPAVAVYFEREGQGQCIPCDKWSRVEDNIQAIRKTIEALRGLERWGAKNMVDAAFQGFKALPSSVDNTDNRPWWEVLGIPSDSNPVEIKRAYIEQAQRWHPDKPDGDAAKFSQVKAAYEQAISMGTRAR